MCECAHRCNSAYAYCPLPLYALQNRRFGTSSEVLRLSIEQADITELVLVSRVVQNTLKPRFALVYTTAAGSVRIS